MCGRVGLSDGLQLTMVLLRRVKRSEFGGVKDLQ